MADRCPTCDRPLATQADYDAHPDGCMCERCLSLCWLTWTVQCQGRPVDWRARALEVQQRLDLAARITPFSAEPCPLCKYDHGRFLSACAMHRHHDELSETIDRQRMRVDALEAALGEALDAMGVDGPGSLLYRLDIADRLRSTLNPERTP